MPHHLLIAGTGRAGTSFLVRLLHEVGLDTHLGGEHGAEHWSDEANAGFEDILGSGIEAPYVVKSPWLYQWIDPLLSSNYTIDGVILPVRDLNDAAASRTSLEYQNMHRVAPYITNQDATWDSWAVVPGGVVYSTHPLDQARLLATGFYKVVQRLTEASIPMYFVAFPRMIEDPCYLYECIGRSLPASVSREEFIEAHRRIADPTKVRIHSAVAASPVQAENLALRRELARVRAENERELRRLREEAERNAELARAKIDQEQVPPHGLLGPLRQVRRRLRRP